jgi:phenol hydroxylase P0 protein
MSPVSEAARKVVRVTGERGGMVMFDYGLDDLDYALELLLPPDAFEAFCRDNAVVRLEGNRPEEADSAAQGMALRPSDVGPRL